MNWIEKEVSITVDSSLNENTNIVSYRLWDSDHNIPYPPEVESVQIWLENKWQDMFFNTVWGKGLDPNNEGTWLKQKTAKGFSAETGNHNYRIRYKLNNSHLITNKNPINYPEGKEVYEKYMINDFVQETGYSAEKANTWFTLLKRKNQIILQGPPGTGKTFIAKRLAKLLVSETLGSIETVQFHPSYSYEDFIQGIFPTLVSGGITFSVKDGRLVNYAKEASNNSPEPFVLIIDEINRANLSQVFGELLYLLEYREEEIKLATNGELFRLPKNVYFIGTMNTADRSIAIVDHALRRRFSFIRIQPEYDVLENHLKKLDMPSKPLIDVLKKINNVIGDPNYEVGISYFMVDKKDLLENLKLIWISEIEPYLEEFFYDQISKIDRFRWENLSSDSFQVYINNE
jgi:5-methylcytosine-specific restriction endonuclease McrBC GTP-binding regulatory subunit McrB